MNINTSSTFDPSKVLFGEPRAGKEITMVDVHYQEPKEKLYIQFPIMKVPFPSKDYNGKYNFCISFEDHSDDEANVRGIKDMYSKLQALETKILETAMENNHEWTRDTDGDEPKPTKDQVKAMFRPFLVRTSQTYAPYITIKIGYPFKGNDPTTTFYHTKVDGTAELVSKPNVASLIQRNERVRVIAVCKGIWCNRTQIGVTWQAESIQVFPSVSKTLSEKAGIKIAQSPDAEFEFDD